MKLHHFHYDLPDELIARFPASERRGSRLLCVEGASIQHRQFADFLSLVNAGDVLVFNNTRVIPARLFGHKSTGGKVEILVERLVGTAEVLAHVRASKSPLVGSEILLSENVRVSMLGREGELFRLQSDGLPWTELLEQFGHMPLPPYIDREDQLADRERYQTVYAKNPGAVAAPTAGLHFDVDMLQALRDMGVETVEVTLHVGAGTFQPVRVENISDHKMHQEWMSIDADVVAKIQAAKSVGHRVIAIGTTAVRTLESAALSGELKPMQGETDIFIYPGYQFRVVDALLTNFHLPESTLLMLVSAFAGYSTIMHAYQEAVEQKYRFFSYGDAMFLTHNPLACQEIPE